MSRLAIKIVVLIMWSLLLPQLVLAEPTYDKYGDLIPPDSEKYSGTLEGLGPETSGDISILVINDTKYRVDDKTLYRNKNGGKSSLSGFSTGMSVDFYAIDYLVTNICVSADPIENGGQTQKNLSPIVPSQSELHFENGVWTN